MQSSPSLSRELLRFAAPVLVAQLAFMANSVIDTAMAGRLSAVDLAAVGISAAFVATVLMSLISVLLALSPIVARLYGAGQRAAIGRELGQTVWIALVLAAIAMLVLLFPGPLTGLLGLQEAVEAKVRAYLYASAWGVPATIALRLFFSLSNGIGRPRPVMVFNLLALGLKIPLNAVFMYGLFGLPQLGGAGCAVATSVDQWLMALFAWNWCLRHPDYAEFELRARLPRPDWAAIRAFLKLGVPIGLTFIADVTAFTLMALFIARLGPVVSGAHQVAANLSVIAFMFPLALGNATSALAGHALGAGDAARARRICWRGVRIGLSIGVFICILYWLGAPYLAALYTSDAAVQAAAIPLIVLAGLYHVGDAVQAVAVNALRAYKKTTVPMITYALLLWGPGLGGGILLGLTGTFGAARGAAGFWLAGIFALWLVGAAMGLYLERVSRVR
jgi:MATE family multidrug resistance protein